MELGTNSTPPAVSAGETPDVLHLTLSSVFISQNTILKYSFPSEVPEGQAGCGSN